MTIPSWAVRGAKVVCIKREAWRMAAGWEGPRVGRMPVFGDQLTISMVDAGEPFVSLQFAECDPFDLFNVAYFRPLVTEKDDLATHFEQYLKTDHRATRRVGEDA